MTDRDEVRQIIAQAFAAPPSAWRRFLPAADAVLEQLAERGYVLAARPRLSIVKGEEK